MINSELTDKEKAKLKSWFRYNHYSTNPAHENHSHFISMLSFLEEREGKKLAEGFNEDENWAEILEAINKLPAEDLAHLYSMTYGIGFTSKFSRGK